MDLPKPRYSREAIVSGLYTFLAGRVSVLVIAVVFQVIVARELSAMQYARYALVFAIIATSQVLTSLGMGRALNKLVPEGMVAGKPKAVGRTLLILFGVRAAVLCIFLPLVLFVIDNLVVSGSRQEVFDLLTPAAIWMVANSFFSDLDSVTQSLMRQKLSRSVAVGEVLIRTSLVILLMVANIKLSAAMICWATACSLVIADCRYLFGIAREFTEASGADQRSWPNWREVVHLSTGSYVSSLSWMLTSSSVVRLVAATSLSTLTLAAYSFLQSLVMSLNRYSPGFLLFQFLEPMVLAEVAKSEYSVRASAALSLIIKIDLVVILTVSLFWTFEGSYLTSAMSAGRYTQEAWLLIPLLFTIVINTTYRTTEIAAAAQSASLKLAWSAPSGAIALAILTLLAPIFGLYAIVVIPLLDGCAKIVVCTWLLRRTNGPSQIDMAVISELILAGVLAGTALKAADHYLFSGTSHVIAASEGVFSIIIFFGILSIVRPLRNYEGDLLLAALPGELISVRSAIHRATRRPAI